MRPDSLKVALTGNIATGKTLVLRELSKYQSFKTLNCDDIVDALYRDKAVKKRLKQMLGTSDKKEVAEKVFKNHRKLLKLEQILWPAVEKKILKEFKGSRKPIVIVEIPLLFESGMEKMFDFIVLVKSTKKEQIKRLMKKGMKRSYALHRINAQKSDIKKAYKAHFVLENDSTKRALIKKTKLLKNMLTDMHFTLRRE